LIEQHATPDAPATPAMSETASQRKSDTTPDNADQMPQFAPVTSETLHKILKSKYEYIARSFTAYKISSIM
jgi:hypothetical protein